MAFMQGGWENLVSAEVNVAAAGTRVQLSAVSVAVRGLKIQSKVGNTGFIFIGGATVSAANGFVLGFNALQPVELTDILPVSDLSLIWIDAAVNGEGVRILYSPTP